MFELARGIEIAGAEHLEEAFVINPVASHTMIRLNVSAPKLKETILRLAEKVDGLGYFALEIPRDELIKWVPLNKPFSVARDTYYLNGLEMTYFGLIMEMFGELLIHDGWVNFGYAAMDGIDGVFVLDDKQIEIHTTSPSKYVALLQGFGFAERDSLRGVRELISSETPLVRRSIDVSGETVEEMIASMHTYGLQLGIAV